MKLSEIPYNELHAGDIVVSDYTGNRGIISFVAEYLDEANNPWIKISWNNGDISVFPYVDYYQIAYFENIIYIGKE